MCFLIGVVFPRVFFLDSSPSLVAPRPTVGVLGKKRRAARTAMGMDPGPELESLSGQRTAGTVTEDRRIAFEGRFW